MQRVLCFSFLLGAAVTAAAGGLDVRLVLYPGETLPGVPVTVAVAIKNVSDNPVAFDASYLQFDLKDATGSATHLTVEVPTQHWKNEWEPPVRIILRPGEQTKLFIPSGQEFTSPLFAEHAVMNRPGEYDLSISVTGSRGQSGVSNPVHLRVITPVGEDLMIWERLNENRDPPPTSTDTMAACSFITRYPQSEYYRLLSPWCLLRESRSSRKSVDEYAPAVSEAASVLPAPMLDALRYDIGAEYAAAAQNAYSRNDVAQASRLSFRGLAYAKQSADRASTDFGSVAATGLAAQFHTENEWRAFYAKAHAPMQAERALVPFVSCITENGDGTFAAHFGYENPNERFVKRPPGEDNRVQAQASDSKVPTQFRPGRVESAFTIKDVKGSVTWTLNGKAATASVATAPRCSDLGIRE